MALVCLLFIVDGNSKPMFGNKQQHAENMDVKFVFYTYCAVYEVLKRNIQYFAIIRAFIISQEWAFEYMIYYM